MRVLVTGSNGLLGQKLIPRLSADTDIEVFAGSRGKNRLGTDYNRYQYFDLDITKPGAAQSVFDKIRPNVVINTAAMTNVDQCETHKEACRELNVNAVKYLIETCQQYGTHLIHLSTDFIFDGEDGPYDEQSKPNPLSYYGESKLASENLVKSSAIPWSIIRTVLVYGVTPEMSRSNIVLWVKESLEQGKNIQVVTDQFRTPTLAEDLAEGCYLAAKKGKTGIFNVSGKDMMTPYDMAVATAEVFQLDEELITATDGSKFSQAAKRPPKTGFDISKARKELGYEPRSFSEGLKIVKDQLEELKANA